MDTPEMSRRGFLRLAGGAVIGFAFINVAGCERNSVEPITLGTELPFITPVESFYYKNGAEGSIPRWSMPVLSKDLWRLTIDGLVGTPLSLRYQDILSEEVTSTVKLIKTMRCVIDSNEVQGLVGTAIWTGVPLRIFLDRAGVDMTRALRLRFYGADGFTNNIKLSRVYGTQPAGLVEPLLVTHINGVPLPEKHGFPVRLLLHEGFGYKNVKWLTRVEAVASNTAFGTYQDQGFIDDGEMRVVSRMTSPIANITVGAGSVRCTGFALSGAAGIRTIELSLDGGAFTQAAIFEQSAIMASDPLLASTIQATEPQNFSYPFRAVWAKWETTFDLTPGTHTIRIRATDDAGNAQPESDSDISDGINAIPSIEIVAA
jgi:DMSO/TMAO reductase YedYZ molybdopterin-dependent catalytic subunit